MKKNIILKAIENKIFLIRGHRVMLDSDLAKLYKISTSRLNEQVKRNQKRFPSDFMFQLTKPEFSDLISQIATSNSRWGGRRKMPLVFTQEGVAMLSGVIHTSNAISANIIIMRTFVKLRETLALHKELAVGLRELENKISSHDAQIQSIFSAIRQLMSPPEKAKKRIGFTTKEKRAKYLK